MDRISISWQLVEKGTMAALGDESELESRLENLRSELECYGKDIKNLTQCIYGCHEDDRRTLENVDLKNSPFQLISLLRQEVLEIVEESQKQEEIINRSQADIKFCDEMSEILSTISICIDLMNHFEDALINFRFKQCFDYLADIELQLEKLPDEEKLLGKGKICRTLRNECNLQKVRIASKILRLLNECISIDHGIIKVNKSLTGYIRCEDKILSDSISLDALWSFAVACDALDEYMDQLADQIWNHLFNALWREKKTQIPSISSNSLFAEIIFVTSNKLNSATRENDFNSTAKTLGSCKMPVPDMFELVGHIINFLWSDVFNGNAEISVVLGKKLFGEPYRFVLELTETISLHMPKSESELNHFRKSLEEPCRLLQRKLDSYFGLSDLAASLNIHPEALTSHIENIFSIFSFIRRRDILKHARDIVMGDYHNTMIASGDVLEDELSTAGDIGDPRALLDQSGSIAIQKLKFDSCQVSLASCRLLKFVHDVMLQAVHASTDVANVLFHSARDCIELFLIIVPTKFSNTIETVPRMGAVFFNDCLYIAHNVVLISHRYRNLMMQRTSTNNSKDEKTLSLQGAISFIDFIPRLRKTAEKVLQGHVISQQAVLREMVRRIKITPDLDAPATSKRANIIAEGFKMAGKFKNSLLHRGTVEGRQGMTMAQAAIGKRGAGETTGEEGENELDNNEDLGIMEDDSPPNNENRAGILLAHLERLSTQWLGVLQEDFYGRMMGMLVEDVLQEAMKPVLVAECITATAASEIYRIFKVLQRSRSLLPAASNSERDTLSTAVQNSNNNNKDFCPSFNKFCALTDMMEFKLNDIANGLNRKRFADFTATEMVKLVKALFEDSPRRQTLLTAIESVPAK